MSRLVTLLMSLLVFWCPFALGGNRPLPWAINAMLAGVMALLCGLTLLSEPVSQHRSGRWHLILLPLLLWGLALSWAALQLLPLGELTHPNWAIGASALGQDLTDAVTASLDATIASLMRMLTYVCVFVVAFTLARDPDRAGLLLRVFVIAASVYALYGLLRFASAADKIIWFDQLAPKVLSSVFINRNSAATYFGMASCVSFVLLLRRTRHVINEAEQEGSVARGASSLMSSVAGRLGLEFAGFVLLLTATVLTQSRAGVAATCFAIASGLLFQAIRSRRHGRGGAATALVIMIGVAGLLVVLQISGTRVVERLIGTDIVDEQRLAVFGDTIAAISDHALTGSGLGTFEDVFPLYRGEAAANDVIWDKAHNDYLEILLGLGIPGGLAIIAGVLILVIRFVSGSFQRRRNSHLPMAGALAGTLAGLHALVDFSLQIQAVALSLAMILGVSVAQSSSDRSR